MDLKKRKKEKKEILQSHVQVHCAILCVLSSLRVLPESLHHLSGRIRGDPAEMGLIKINMALAVWWLISWLWRHMLTYISTAFIALDQETTYHSMYSVIFVVLPIYLIPKGRITRCSSIIEPLLPSMLLCVQWLLVIFKYSWGMCHKTCTKKLQNPVFLKKRQSSDIKTRIIFL